MGWIFSILLFAVAIFRQQADMVSIGLYISSGLFAIAGSIATLAVKIEKK